MTKKDQILNMIAEGYTNPGILREIDTSPSQVASLRSAFNASQRFTPTNKERVEVDDNGSRANVAKSPVKKNGRKQSQEALLIVSGLDDEAQQLVMKAKAKAIPMPDLLPIAMTMSRRLWGWPEYDVGTFIDVCLYNLFNACGQTLFGVLDRNTNTIITKYEEETLDYAAIEDIGGGEMEIIGEESEYISDDEESEDIEQEDSIVIEPQEHEPQIIEEIPEPDFDFTPKSEVIPWYDEDESVSIPKEITLETIFNNEIYGSS